MAGEADIVLRKTMLSLQRIVAQMPGREDVVCAVWCHREGNPFVYSYSNTG